MKAVAARRSRFGYRRIGVMQERKGMIVNHKRLYLLYSEEKLGVPHPQQIEAGRRAHADWWQALGWIRDGLCEGGYAAHGRGDRGDAEGKAVEPRVTSGNTSKQPFSSPSTNA
ncbi:hypothetical protein SAMN04488239_10899 [Ruegeria marina]|uniref:HTH-like domain-containing protein n=1 Tax=Ruegeria marina TaxID=639004 RepID=A0A1G6VNX6_9RHOB|nr:hypothetical protein SAMN04488239_10899 [Ruegeria marina]